VVLFFHFSSNSFLTALSMNSGAALLHIKVVLDAPKAE